MNGKRTWKTFWRKDVTAIVLFTTFLGAGYFAASYLQSEKHHVENQQISTEAVEISKDANQIQLDIQARDEKLAIEARKPKLVIDSGIRIGSQGLVVVRNEGGSAAAICKIEIHDNYKMGPEATGPKYAGTVQKFPMDLSTQPMNMPISLAELDLLIEIPASEIRQLVIDLPVSASPPIVVQLYWSDTDPTAEVEVALWSINRGSDVSAATPIPGVVNPIAPAANDLFAPAIMEPVAPAVADPFGPPIGDPFDPNPADAFAPTPAVEIPFPPVPPAFESPNPFDDKPADLSQPVPCAAIPTEFS